MNFHNHLIPPQHEAKLRYADGDYAILKEGDFVRCFVSGDPIHLDNLRYWNVDKQVAYKSAREALLDLKRG